MEWLDLVLPSPSTVDNLPSNPPSDCGSTGRNGSFVRHNEAPKQNIAGPISIGSHDPLLGQQNFRSNITFDNSTANGEKAVNYNDANSMLPCVVMDDGDDEGDSLSFFHVERRLMKPWNEVTTA